MITIKPAMDVTINQLYHEIMFVSFYITGVERLRPSQSIYKGWPTPFPSVGEGVGSKPFGMTLIVIRNLTMIYTEWGLQLLNTCDQEVVTSLRPHAH